MSCFRKIHHGLTSMARQQKLNFFRWDLLTQYDAEMIIKDK